MQYYNPNRVTRDTAGFPFGETYLLPRRYLRILRVTSLWMGYVDVKTIFSVTKRLFRVTSTKSYKERAPDSKHYPKHYKVDHRWFEGSTASNLCPLYIPERESDQLDEQTLRLSGKLVPYQQYMRLLRSSKRAIQVCAISRRYGRLISLRYIGIINLWL
jgi:hypothetical protein